MHSRNHEKLFCFQWIHIPEVSVCCHPEPKELQLGDWSTQSDGSQNLETSRKLPDKTGQPCWSKGKILGVIFFCSFRDGCCVTISGVISRASDFCLSGIFHGSDKPVYQRQSAEDGHVSRRTFSVYLCFLFGLPPVNESDPRAWPHQNCLCRGTGGPVLPGSFWSVTILRPCPNVGRQHQTRCWSFTVKRRALWENFAF